tara:strand:- start:91 stop:621 length:531 start_codon:yes stop_codon:yes gene_type:complete
MNKNLSNYAKALYEVSVKKKNVAKIQNELNAIHNLYKKVPTFKFVIITKSLTSNQKKDVLKNTLHSFDSLIIEFLSLIIDGGFYKHLVDIIKYFNKLINAESKINNVDLIVAEKIDDNFLDSLSLSLSSILKTKPEINIIIKPEIIGGIKLKIGNKVFDNSISNQLNKLKQTLYNM